MEKDAINTPCEAYIEMAKRWPLIHDLLGGTVAMRDAAGTWLPREQDEKIEHYNCRVGRAILLESLKDTIDSLVARPFSQALSIKELPTQLEYFEKDMDGQGTTRHEGAAELFEDMVTYGLCHELIDFTQVPANNNGRATLAEESAAGARVIASRIPPPDLIFWSSELRGGERALTEIRFFEYETRKKGVFLQESVTYLKVVREDSWERWLIPEEGEPSKESEGLYTLGYIPLVTTYAKKTGFMTARPPLEPLAWLNLAHYQSSAAQRHILQVARFAILFAKGLTKKQADEGIAVGPFQAFTTAGDNAEMKFVEHQGHAIKAGQADLDHLEQQMESLGKSPLIDRTNKGTATGSAIDFDKRLTVIQKWIRALELGLRKSFEVAAEWYNLELSSDFGVDVYSDFQVATYADNDCDFLLKATIAKKMTVLVFLQELRRRGKLAESLDLEKIAAELAEEDQLLPMEINDGEDED